MATAEDDEALRIFTPIGCVGYGYSTPTFWHTLATHAVDAIICDAGSTDSGPQKLALGSTTVPRESYDADLEPMVAAAHGHRVPVIITSAGGDGADAHVDLFVELIDGIVKRGQYRTLKVLKLYAEIPKATVHEALDAGSTSPCGGGVPALTHGDIDASTRIVAQMGIQPFLKAMRENPDFDIIIAGRTYDPAPYAAFCVHSGFPDLGVAYHMGKIMECGAQCAVPKSRSALATIWRGGFDVVPLDPGARCSALSVAAHTLYEKARPDLHYGPDGVLDLRRATYKELRDGRSVRVEGSNFEAFTEASGWTVKLEGARTDGFHRYGVLIRPFSVCWRDPILISQLSDLLPRIRAFVASKCPFEHELKLTTYGFENALQLRNASDRILSALQRPQPATVGLLGQAKASTQGEANMVVAMARIACVHGPYQGQKATSGNFAMPTAPQEIPMGAVTVFNIYHLIAIADPCELFACEVHDAVGSGECRVVDEPLGPGETVARKNETDPKRRESAREPLPSSPTAPPPFAFKPNQLGSLASVIRAKNAGPFEVTFDIMFDSEALYAAVKSSGVLSKSRVAECLGIAVDEVSVAMWWDPALAFKATVVRPMVSGGFGEVDMHSSTQHVGLMELEVPLKRSPKAKLTALGLPGRTGWDLWKTAAVAGTAVTASAIAGVLWRNRGRRSLPRMER